MKIHPMSDVQSDDIGGGTCIWQFVVVLRGAKIGGNCNVGSHCFIEGGAVIGDRVTVKNGVYIFDAIELEDDVFVGPNVTFTNDLYPRSRRGAQREAKEYPKTLVKKGASIGGGAVILPGVTIGEEAIIGAGAIVAKDVPARGVVYGDASRLRRELS